MKKWVAGLVWAVLVACGSDSGSDGGGTGGSAGDGGGCPPECFAANECVKQCGDTPVNYGCCSCPSDMKNVLSCKSDGGGDAAGDASCAPQIANPTTVACGAASCGPDQICVSPCCGGAPPIDGEACKPPPPFCAPVGEISCCGSASSCSHAGSSCSGMLSGQMLSCLCA